MNLNKLKPIFLSITFLIGLFLGSFCPAFAAKEYRLAELVKTISNLNRVRKSKRPAGKKRRAKILKREGSCFQKMINSSLPIDRIDFVKDWIEKMRKDA